MRYYFPVLLSLIVFAACKTETPPNGNVPAQPEQTAQSVSPLEGLPDDFKVFYDRFHKDSAFQMAHIVWPLKGDAPQRIDSTTYQQVAKVWEPENWRLHKAVDHTDKYLKFSYNMVGDILIIEKMTYVMANYGVERRFAKDLNTKEWELIYYSSIQEKK